MKYNKMNFAFSLIFLFLSGCAYIQKVNHSEHHSPVTDSPLAQPESQEAQLSPIPVQSVSEEKKISVILGPGGWRYFAHAGVLAELHKAGYHVAFISGLEKSTLPAMIYADNPSVSQVEWQLFKLTLEDLIKMPKVHLKNRSIESFTVPFACSSYSVQQRRSYVLTKGLAYPTLNMCYEQFADNPKGISFANPLNLYAIFEIAKQYSPRILYVDILSKSEIEANVEGYQYSLWSEGIQSFLKLRPEVEILYVPLKGESRNFNLRQSWMRDGARAAQQWIEAQNLKP